MDRGRGKLPVKPPRSFEADYPHGVAADDTGKLLYDVEGRPLIAPIIAGRRTLGGADQALSTAELNAVGAAGTPEGITELPSRAIGGDLGAVNAPGGMPRNIFLSSKLSSNEYPLVLGHEVGHVVDMLSGGIPQSGLFRELGGIYNSLNNPQSYGDKFSYFFCTVFASGVIVRSACPSLALHHHKAVKVLPRPRSCGDGKLF